jgi:hypothetical protein
MMATLVKTSYSPNVNELGDCSTGIFNAGGRPPARRFVPNFGGPDATASSGEPTSDFGSGSRVRLPGDTSAWQKSLRYLTEPLQRRER